MEDDRVERAIRVALTGVIDRDAHDLVIALSLEYARTEYLPEEGDELAAFLAGPFHTAVESFFGTTEADAVYEELESILGDRLPGRDDTSRISGVRAKLRVVQTPVPPTPSGSPAGLFSAGPARPTVRVDEPLEQFGKDTIPAPRPGGRTVYLVTRDGETYGCVASSLGESASVVSMSNTPSMIDALRRDEPNAPVVVIDCRAEMSESTLATLAPDLPSTSEVIVWGDESQVDAQLAGVRDPSDRWVRLDSEAHAIDLAQMLRALMG